MCLTFPLEEQIYTGHQVFQGAEYVSRNLNN